MSEEQQILAVIGFICCLMIGKKGFLTTGRWLVQRTGQMFGCQWHGFPRVHRIKRATWTREHFTGETVEIFRCGIHVEHIRAKSELVCCSSCGKTISERPIGKFIYTSQGEMKIS